MPPSDPTCLTLPADDKHGYCHCCPWCSFQDLESDMILCFLFHQLAAVGRSGNLLGKVWNCEDMVSDGTCVGVKISKTFLTFLNLHYPFGRLQMSRPNTGRGYRPPHPRCVGHCHLGMTATTLTCSANSFPGDWNYVTMMSIHKRSTQSCALIQLMVVDQVTGWHSSCLWRDTIKALSPFQSWSALAMAIIFHRSGNNDEQLCISRIHLGIDTASIT